MGHEQFQIDNLSANSKELPAKRVVRVTVFPNCWANGLHPEDVDVPGVYEVTVPADLSDAHAANCALDGFNMAVGIKLLYMFDFKVTDPLTGKVLIRDGALDFYDLEEKCLSVELLFNL